MTQERDYTTWIENWLDQNGGPNKDGYGRCKEAAEAMTLAFPELEVTKGHVLCSWGDRGHWWCKTPDGQIVDPTARQFQSLFSYEEYFPGMHIRLGRCMECGEDIHGPESLEGVYSTSHCSESCEKSFVASMF